MERAPRHPGQKHENRRLHLSEGVCISAQAALMKSFERDMQPSRLRNKHKFQGSEQTRYFVATSDIRSLREETPDCLLGRMAAFSTLTKDRQIIWPQMASFSPTSPFPSKKHESDQMRQSATCVGLFAKWCKVMSWNAAGVIRQRD